MKSVDQHIRFNNTIFVDTSTSFVDTPVYPILDESINLIKVKYRLLGYYDANPDNTQDKVGLIYAKATNYGTFLVTSTRAIWEKSNQIAFTGQLLASVDILFTSSAPWGFWIRTNRGGNAYDVSAMFDITIHYAILN